MYQVLKKCLSNQCLSIWTTRLWSTAAALPKQDDKEAAILSHHISQIPVQEIPMIDSRSDVDDIEDSHIPCISMTDKGKPVSLEMLMKEFEYLKSNRKIRKKRY